MLSNPTIQVILAAVVGVIALAIYYYLTRRKKRGDDAPLLEPASVGYQADGKVQGVVNIRLFDNYTRTVFNTSITPEAANKIVEDYPDYGLGRQISRDGKLVYYINRYKNEDGEPELRPVQAKEPTTITNAPNALHNDIAQPEVGLAIGELLKADVNSLTENFWRIFPWLLAIGFLLFLWTQSGR